MHITKPLKSLLLYNPYIASYIVYTYGFMLATHGVLE